MNALTEELSLDRVGQELADIYFDIDFVNRMPMLIVVQAVPEVLYSLTKCTLHDDIEKRHKCVGAIKEIRF